MPKERKLQFTEAKLTGIVKIWWTSYKKSFSKLGNGKIITWSEMKTTKKKRFKPRDFKQRAHIQLNQLEQGSLFVEDYINQFQQLVVRAGIKCNNKILVAMYIQGLHPQISQGLCYHYYHLVDDVIQIT